MLHHRFARNSSAAPWSDGLTPTRRVRVLKFSRGTKTGGAALTALRRLTAALFLCVCAACATTQVRRMDVNEVKDVSGRWNDTDARLVAEEMIQDSISRPWLAKATQRKGTGPTGIRQSARNKSMEHTDTRGFVGELHTALMNPSKVEMSADADQTG